MGNKLCNACDFQRDSLVLYLLKVEQDQGFMKAISIKKAGMHAINHDGGHHKLPEVLFVSVPP